MDPDAEPNTYIFKIIILLILIILSAFFSSAETAFTSVNKIRIRQLSQEGNKRAKTVEQILSKKDEMLSTVLIGNNFVNLFASSITTTLVYELYGNIMASIATGILTLIILIFGEVIPKTIANKYSIKMSMIYSKNLLRLMFLLKPIIFIINKFSYFIMKIMHIDSNKKDAPITEEIIKTMVDMSQEEGQIELEEHKMVNNVLELDDNIAKDIMIPRNQICGVRINDSYETIIKTFKENKYTRLLVWNNAETEVMGILNIKDILFKNQEDFNIKNVLRQPYIIPESKKLSDLLKELKKASVNIAVVISEYGEVSGILTLEDIIEELVGQIRDEYDEEELKDIVQIKENEYSVNAAMNLNDINDFFDINLKSEEYNTLGGFIIEKLDRIPQVEDAITFDKISFEVLKTTNNRIDRIKIKM